MDLGSPAVSTALAAVITPLLIWALGWIFPPRQRAEFAELPPDELRNRNTWIEYGFTAIFFVGLCIGIGFYVVTGASPYDPLGGEIGGVIAGLGPFVFLVLVSGFSVRRFGEYIYFCEMNHGMSRAGLAVILVPVLFVGLLSLIYLGHRAAI